MAYRYNQVNTLELMSYKIHASFYNKIFVQQVLNDFMIKFIYKVIFT